MGIHKLVGNLLYNFSGDYSKAIAYCAKIVAMRSCQSQDYADAAILIKKRALDSHHSSTLA